LGTTRTTCRCSPGRKSIAPANAHSSVLAEVDEVTEANDEDGVALAIERLLVARANGQTSV